MDKKIYNGQIFHPFAMVVAGASQSGKTEFVIKLLKERAYIIDVEFKTIIWCFGQNTPRLQMLNNIGVKLVKGIPENFSNKKKTLFIIDDLFDSACSNKKVFDLFTKGVHHDDVSVILLFQDLFYQGGIYRKTLIRNTQYMVLFKTPMDMSVIDSMARKIIPRNPKKFYEIFDNATKNPYTYLFISAHQKTPKELRFKSNIFDGYQLVYEL